MLSYAMLCYVMLCCAMLCYAMLCYDMLCIAMLCYAVLCIAMLCCDGLDRSCCKTDFILTTTQLAYVAIFGFRLFSIRAAKLIYIVLTAVSAQCFNEERARRTVL